MANATIVGGELFTWTFLDDFGAADVSGISTGELDLGDGTIDKLLHIATAQTVNGTAGIGLNIEVYGKAGANNEDYHLLGTLGAGGSAAILTATMDEAVDADVNGSHLHVDATTVLDDADATTGRWLLLDATPANSELVKIIGWSDGAFFNLSQAVTLDHADTGALFPATEQPFNVPNGIRYVQVIFSNKDTAANYYCHVSYSGVSDFV